MKISDRNLVTKLLVEEFHLKSEEKWILDSLKKIRNQRNALQVERMQLESIKAKLIENPEKSKLKTDKKEISKKDKATNLESKPCSSKDIEQSELELIDDMETYNRRQVDLSVMNSLNMILEKDFSSLEEESSDEDTDAFTILGP